VSHLNLLRLTPTPYLPSRPKACFAVRICSTASLGDVKKGKLRSINGESLMRCCACGHENAIAGAGWCKTCGKPPTHAPSASAHSGEQPIQHGVCRCSPALQLCVADFLRSLVQVSVDLRYGSIELLALSNGNERTGA